MDTKLTLNVDQEVIDQAKMYAKSHKISLSRLIESLRRLPPS
jgi:predicted HicB family RNase H-like nuclease